MQCIFKRRDIRPITRVGIIEKDTNKIERDRHHPTIFFPVLDLQIRLSGHTLRIPSVDHLPVQILDPAVVRHLPLVPSSPVHVA